MGQIAYLVKHKNLDTRLKSRSGGFFVSVTDVVINKGGYIYGCAINDKFLAEHRKALTKDERNKFQGSKYVQSDMKNCFQEIKNDLITGESVLFSGTGCQVAALKAYLHNVDISKLLTIDIVCHGVPSPLIWKSFMTWMEEKYKGKIQKVDFRDKRYGWMSHFETVCINDTMYVADYYRAIFYKHYSLRPSCYKCPYANLERSGDISIADAWGIDKKNSDFNDDRGVSLVIINTEAGKALFEQSKENIQYREVNILEFMQPNLISPSISPNNRAEFWNDFFDKGFDFVSKKYGENTFKGNLISYIKRILGRTRTTKYIKMLLKI